MYLLGELDRSGIGVPVEVDTVKDIGALRAGCAKSNSKLRWLCVHLSLFASVGRLRFATGDSCEKIASRVTFSRTPVLTPRSVG